MNINTTFTEIIEVALNPESSLKVIVQYDTNGSDSFYYRFVDRKEFQVVVDCQTLSELRGKLLTLSKDLANVCSRLEKHEDFLGVGG